MIVEQFCIITQTIYLTLPQIQHLQCSWIVLNCLARLWGLFGIKFRKSGGSSQVYSAGEMVDVDLLNIAESEHFRLLLDRTSQAIGGPNTLSGIYDAHREQNQNQESLV